MNFILIAIIVANVVISYKGFNDLYFFRKYEFHVGSIRSGEQIRMLSSGFLHVDMMHLIFNMLTLYFFAPVVLNWLGNFSFVLVYFGSLIFGSLLTMLLHKNDYSYRAVGASGAVTGVLYSAIAAARYDAWNIFCHSDASLYFWNFVFIVLHLWNESQK